MQQHLMSRSKTIITSLLIKPSDVSKMHFEIPKENANYINIKNIDDGKIHPKIRYINARGYNLFNTGGFLIRCPNLKILDLDGNIVMFDREFKQDLETEGIRVITSKMNTINSDIDSD